VATLSTTSDSPPSFETEQADTIGYHADRTLRIGYLVLFLLLGGLMVASLGIGRYPIPFMTVLNVLGAHLLPAAWQGGFAHGNGTEQLVVLHLRLPRILGAVLAGMVLSMAGATLQGLFRNPLVDAHIIGISSGASFGGVLALLFALPAAIVVGSSFAVGLLALILVFAMSRVTRGSGVTTLVLAGLVTGTFFSALLGLVLLAADPEAQLPGIIYWLMGSFSRLDYPHLGLFVLPAGIAGLLLYRMRWQINLLSLGDADARGLGVAVNTVRWLALILVTLMVAAQVAVSGGIGWVGLVIPHLARLLTGSSDHRRLLPVSALLGGIFMLAIDDLARGFTAQELPVGLLAALLGTPVFAYLLWHRRSTWRSADE
jgi:iron complex transport system permease protein